MSSARKSMGNAVENFGKAFQEDGAVGKTFTPEGSAGGAAQALGGPFDQYGTIGKQFSKEGPAGGAAQQMGEDLSKARSSLEGKS
ncbi:hypothetical protein WJX84_003930 [Apatococcus fuscideae]|uniref:Uncharacterized protein n=1 Tax=Apatococcus fuscideae TaxID=2026836 RepID=A0AAW1SQJ7_9CHLO